MNAQVVMFVITSEGPVSFMQIEYYRCARDVLRFRFSLFYFLLIVVFRDKVSEGG